MAAKLCCRFILKGVQNDSIKYVPNPNLILFWKLCKMHRTDDLTAIKRDFYADSKSIPGADSRSRQ